LDTDEDYVRRDSYKRKRRPSFDLEEFEEALIELGESSSAKGGAVVECGLCDKSIHVPEDKKTKTRINLFKKLHYNKCLKSRTEGEDSEEEDGGNDQDCLDDVYEAHKAQKEADNHRTAQGRRKADIPPIETIRSFLSALGSATVVNRGHQIKCGLCANKLRVNIGRTIMGNIRYFERTHFLRCPIRIAQVGKPTELISEAFIPGRTPATRILNTIHLFDMKRARIVSSLIGDRDGDIKRLPGRPRKGEEVYDTPKIKTEYYVSKRKQCLAATQICFKCKLIFDSGSEVDEHFRAEHPGTSSPFYCLACQEHFTKYDDVIEHLDVDHNYKSYYSCPFCDHEEFITQSKLNRHVTENHPDEEEQMFTCTMCTKGFSSFQALKNHQKTHLNVDPEMMVDPTAMISSIQEAFTCRFCGENIMSRHTP
jgi:hypothetical protein